MCRKITKAGTDIADCLSKMTGLTYKIEVGTNFAASIEAMGAGKAQIGFLNTFSVLLAEHKYGIRALAAANTAPMRRPGQGQAGKTFYQGQFIANKASGIKSFADLKGKTFCFVDPNSTSGYIIPRIVLKANGIDPDKDFKATQNAGSHDNVAIAVYKGDCDAGVDLHGRPHRLGANLKATIPTFSIRSISSSLTDHIPNDGMQFVKDLDPEIKDATVTGLLAMADDPGGKAMLASSTAIDGLARRSSRRSTMRSLDC